MLSKIYAIIAILVALLIGTLTITLPDAQIARVVLLTKFFLAMLPILGVAVLVKYLFKCQHN